MDVKSHRRRGLRKVRGPSEVALGADLRLPFDAVLVYDTWSDGWSVGLEGHRTWESDTWVWVLHTRTHSVILGRADRTWKGRGNSPCERRALRDENGKMGLDVIEPTSQMSDSSLPSECASQPGRGEGSWPFNK